MYQVLTSSLCKSDYLNTCTIVKIIVLNTEEIGVCVNRYRLSDFNVKNIDEEEENICNVPF